MTKRNYIFKIILIYVVLLSFFCFFNLEIKVYNYGATTQNEEKVVSSDTLKKDEENIQAEQVITDTEQKLDMSVIDNSSFPVLSQETINLSHYGHDCYGCTTGYTASGYYVGDGRIYYEDSTFGTVRVVAADSKYPLGTIVRIKYHGDIITAIVLDRGGAIGDNNKFQIDLLTTSNSEAYSLGVVKNTNLEVLRFGY